MEIARQERRLPAIHATNSYNKAGLLTSGSTDSPRLPLLIRVALRLLSPVTAAAPRRIYTVFPILWQMTSCQHLANQAAILNGLTGKSTASRSRVLAAILANEE